MTYCTNIDTHAHPELVRNHRCFVSLAHDEYYSTAMRRGLEAARDTGINLVFFGANCCFRKIRLEPSASGPHRLQVNYRSAADDPMRSTDPAEVTVSWREAPSGRPESSLVGNYYEANPVDAAMVVANADNWLFEGSGLRNGDALPHLIGNEYDRVTPEAPTPANIEVLCHSPLVCKRRKSFSDVTWYSAASGAGVFATGTFWWVPQLAPDTRGQPPSAANPAAAIQRVTANLLTAMSTERAGAAHPSTNNLAALGIHRGYIKHPPT